MKHTNSPLIDHTRISPNRTSPRNHGIDTITIHCMAGDLSVEACGSLFASAARKASSNYGIGSDGRIALYVEERDRSWCSSNAANDNRAVTIEVANDGGAPDWHVSDKAMASLIRLTADICKRNQIKELKWKADKSLIGNVGLQNMTVHRWFAAKSCPGSYLYGRHSYIAEQVNRILAGSCSAPANSPSVQTPDNRTPAHALVNRTPAQKPDNNSSAQTPDIRSSAQTPDSSPSQKPVIQATAAQNPTHQVPPYVWQNVDYSPVFDPAYYANACPDLQAAFGTDTAKLFRHFCQYGMKEGRVASASFNVHCYRSYHTDLRNAFGGNLPLYYKHYILYGKKENRRCT